MALNTRFKKTEVGAIPANWDVKLLSDVCRFRSGRSHEQYISEYGKHVFVNSKFIASGGRVRKFSSENFSPARKGDVLMVMSDLPNGRALAKAYFVQEDELYAVNQRVCSLSPYRDHPKYLYYALNRNPYFLKFDDGVNQTNLLNRVFLNCPVALPPTLEEQCAIAAALSDVDVLLDSLDQLIAKKRDLKQAAMQQLLTGNTRLLGSRGGWETKNLGALAQLYQPKTISQSVFTSEGCPVYGANGIIGYYHMYNHSTPQITISCRGNCGTVNKTDPFSWITGNAMVVNFDRNNKVDWDFMYYLLMMQDFSVLVTGSGQPQIVRGPLSEFPVALPESKAEQRAIAIVLSDMDAELGALEQRRAKTAALKQGMMQELLTGRTRLV